MANEAVTVLEDVGGFFKKLFTDLTTAKAIFDELSPEVKAVFVPIFQAAVNEAKNVQGAVAASGLNVTLDITTVNALLSLIAQFKSGVKSVVKDFKSLEVKL